MAEMTEQELRDSLQGWKRNLSRDRRKLSFWKKALQRAKAAVAKRNRQLSTFSNQKAKDVIHWELQKVGVHEDGFNNTGPDVDKWESAFGFHAAPYCALFQMYAIKNIAHIDVPSNWAFTPNILNDARAKRNGLTGLHSWEGVEIGDLVLFHWDSADPVQHVGMYIGNGRTLEANTSPGTSGSQDNGGGVYIRSRNGDGVVGCARLDWSR